MAGRNEERPELTVRDARTLRALAHPARLRIITHLADGRTATATECAEVCGLSPSATSYHLRALARAALIEEAPSRGDGRERLWQARAGGFQVDIAQDASAEELAAARDLIDVFLAQDQANAQAWLGRSQDEPKEWHDAAVMNTAHLIMTAEEVNRLTEEVKRLTEPYRRNLRPEPPAGARTVAITFRAIPTD